MVCWVCMHVFMHLRAIHWCIVYGSILHLWWLFYYVFAICKFHGYEDICDLGGCVLHLLCLVQIYQILLLYALTLPAFPFSPRILLWEIPYWKFSFLAVEGSISCMQWMKPTSVASSFACFTCRKCKNCSVELCNDVLLFPAWIIHLQFGFLL